MRDGVDHRVGQRAPVEAARAEKRDASVRAGQVRIAEPGADVAGRAVRIEEERPARRDVIEEVDVGGGLVDERLVHREAASRHHDRGQQGLAERYRAVPVERVGPTADRARHADRKPGVSGVVERQRSSAGEERVGSHRRGRGLPMVDRGELPVPGAVDHHEAAAADATGERLGDAEDRGGRHGSVHGVAAAAQHPDRRLRGERVDRGRSATESDRGRSLGRSGARPSRWPGSGASTSADVVKSVRRDPVIVRRRIAAPR